MKGKAGFDQAGSFVARWRRNSGVANMIVLDEKAVAEALPWKKLVECLREAFRSDVEAPGRAIYDVPLDGADPAALMLMPAWRKEDVIGVKLVTVFKRNSQIGRPGIAGLYVLFSGSDGRALATVEGGELTARRTAAASALAADYLARGDASTLLMVGTGRLSLNIPQAYRAIRPIERVLVWGRREDEAAKRAEELSDLGFASEPVASVSEGLVSADIVSCATNATAPLVPGDDVRPGTHVDLIGAFQPTMRESDDEVMRKADVIVADTFEGVFEEAGDILQAIDSGAITRSSVVAELADLCNGDHSGRLNNEQVTVFKSCGTALEDLAAAQLALSAQT